MDRRQLFGESVAGTIVRLVLLSIVVGIMFSALDINLFNIVERFQLLMRRIAEFGFDALHWALRYFVLGAVVVVPIWFIVRLLKRGPRRDTQWMRGAFSAHGLARRAPGQLRQLRAPAVRVPGDGARCISSLDAGDQAGLRRSGRCRAAAVWRPPPAWRWPRRPNRCRRCRSAECARPSARGRGPAPRSSDETAAVPRQPPASAARAALPSPLRASVVFDTAMPSTARSTSTLTVGARSSSAMSGASFTTTGRFGLPAETISARACSTRATRSSSAAGACRSRRPGVLGEEMLIVK